MQKFPSPARRLPVVRAPSRRAFLLASTAAFFALPALTACASANGDNTLQGQVPVGKPQDLAVGQLRVIPGTAAAVGRDAGGIYALSLICTHTGCDMTTNGSVTSSAIDCACHGSRFDANGEVLRGPARRPLDHYAVTLDDTGELIVDGDQTVGIDVRLVV